MNVLLTTIWCPPLSLFSGWLVMVVVISASACLVVSLRRISSVILGQLLMIVGAPILFTTVLFSEAGMSILKDGREFGFPIWARAYPNASDFLATYIVLGASYLIARKATLTPLRSIRIIGWIEVSGFAALTVFELFLLGARIYVG